jgi:Protein of unknown function (DUF1579)
MKQPIRSPQEERLDFFVGNWKNSGKLMPGSLGPGGDIVGTTSYAWAVGGKWLQYTSNLELPHMGKYEVQGGVVFNNQTKKYEAYAVNSTGALMVYKGDWIDKNTLVFLLTYPPPADQARIVYHKLPDGSIQMKSDQLQEDGEFETYFETYLVRE